MDPTSAIVATASNLGVDPNLALAVAIRESGLNPSAVNQESGAIGLFQIMPATAAELGIDPNDPIQNIEGGIRYLGEMLAKFGDRALALAAYDWGPGHVSHAVATWGADWLAHAPTETQNYVVDILGSGAGAAGSGAPSAPVELSPTLFTPAIGPAARPGISGVALSVLALVAVIMLSFALGER
jgi:soluble lytic murein transglycosylase-like protein